MGIRSSKLSLGIILTILLVLQGSLLAPRAAAQEQPGVTMTVQAGFDRYCRENRWIPLRIILENHGADLEGQVEARIHGATGGETTYTYSVSLPTTSRKEIPLFIFPEGYLTEIPVSLSAGGKTIASEKARVTCLSASDRLIGVLAKTASAFAFLADLDPPNGSATVAELEPGDIPGQGQALQALDILVISDIDTGVFSTAQRQALEDWVSGGGLLWVAGGAGWQKTSAGLGKLLPLVLEVAQASPVNGLESFLSTGAGEKLEEEAVVATGRLEPDGEILARQDETDLPLILRKRLGAGQVIFLAADPALSPLRGWDGILEIYQTLVDMQTERPGWSLGYQDWYLADQAASTFPSLNLPSGLLICGLLGVYILAIGPLNFIVLRKLKRRELAWVSIPTLVIAFSALAFFFGNRLRGNLVQVNRLAIVHGGGESGQVRVDGLLGVYSPNRSSYQLQANPGFLMHDLPNTDATREWIFQESGFQESGFQESGFQESGQMSVKNLRVDIGGIVPLALEGNIPSPAITHDLVLSVQGAKNPQAVLKGSLTNDSDLTLDRAVLLAPGTSSHLGVLEPGKTISIDLSLPKAQRAGLSGKPIMIPRSIQTSPPVFYTPDTTIEEILGTQVFYDNKDSYRRYAILASALNANSMGFSRGGGFYLSGWTNTSPLDVSLASSRDASPVPFDTLDTTLYLITLTPSYELGKGPVILPPGVFTWTVIDSSQPSDATPYGINLTSGSYSIQFDLALPIIYDNVQSLVLHLKSSSPGSGPTGLNLSLWNYPENTWIMLPASQWGDTEVPDPGLFVGPGGQVRLRIEDSDPTRDTQIDTADFSLVVTSELGTGSR